MENYNLENTEHRIKVVDSPPGTGKTSWAINFINQLPDDTKVIYITPYLDEVSRILVSCENKKFTQPRVDGYGTKMGHLVKLAWDGANIVSTHALLANITEELVTALRTNNYILILDEVFQTVNKYNFVESRNRKVVDNITKQDVGTMLAKNIIAVNDDFSVSWVDEKYLLSKYEQVKSLADRGLLYLVNDALLMWTFPIEVFREGIFSEVYILTYQFPYQLQAYYYEYFKIEYGLYEIDTINEEYIITLKTKDSTIEQQWIDNIRDKINILDHPRLNIIGDYYRNRTNRLVKSALSKNWYEHNKEAWASIRKNLSNYANNICKVSSEEFMWACFKEHAKRIKPRNISYKNWVALNARATNTLGHKTALAYMVNRYVDPFYEDFFEKKNIHIDGDMYALSELLQWIWRSAIRNDKEIILYIPSRRMRELLEDFLQKG